MSGPSASTLTLLEYPETEKKVVLVYIFIDHLNMSFYLP